MPEASQILLEAQDRANAQQAEDLPVDDENHPIEVFLRSYGLNAEGMMAYAMAQPLLLVHPASTFASGVHIGLLVAEIKAEMEASLR